MKSCAAAALAAAMISSSRGLRLAEGDVLADGAAEQGGLLQHDADLRAQRIERHIAQVVPVDGDAAFGRIVEARQQVDDGGLAGAGGAEQRNRLAGLGFKGDILQHRVAAAEIAEGHVLELHQRR